MQYSFVFCFFVILQTEFNDYITTLLEDIIKICANFCIKGMISDQMSHNVSNCTFHTLSDKELRPSDPGLV